MQRTHRRALQMPTWKATTSESIARRMVARTQWTDCGRYAFENQVEGRTGRTKGSEVPKRWCLRWIL